MTGFRSGRCASVNIKKPTLRIHVLIFLCIGLAPISVNAESNNPLPRVTAVNGRIEVGQTITVDVGNLSSWSNDHDPWKLVPYLNGRPLTHIYPEQVNLSENRLLFHLQRPPESKKEWENLFHEPVLSRPVSFSVGQEQQRPFETVFDYDHRLALTVIPRTWGIVSLTIVLGLLILLVFLSIRTNILRGPGPSATPGKFRPYDLGRVQTAFWFFIVTTAYFCIWLITGDLDTLNRTVLALIGMSTATVVGTRLIGSSGNLTDKPVAVPELLPSPATSAGFFRDILSDTNGYSFHRFQLVSWTILLGFIFAFYVYDDLRVPTFSGSLLALMGISAGTYMGFEMLDKPSSAAALGARSVHSNGETNKAAA